MASPVNWEVGDDIIIPTSVSDEAATAKYGEFEAILPYLRKASLVDVKKQ